MNTPHLDNHFQNYFDVLLADTAELREQVYRLRYDVYCREFHYEREEDCPGGMERDDYDSHSLHVLIAHKASNTGAGCMRLISPPAAESGFLLPMERFCGQSLTDPVWHPARLPRSHIAEVSRLAVHTWFRRRLGESESPIGIAAIGDFSPDERRTFPLLSLALFYGGAALMVLAGRSEAFVMVEPRLARRLQMAGLPFIRIGEVIEYHGPRAAYYVPVQQVLDNIQGEFRYLYDFVYRSLAERIQGAALDSSLAPLLRP
ncbi:MAG TPA: PEP-CTERM/exosortase system-associated acyltransferase [Gammaproteobacteria bacterium]|nr:PEP-CTERM/exosortase system-associated acyltransferase [Gammaproteobacteria bacterium]